MLTAGTLGTASGDFTADVVGLGLFYGSAALTALFAVVLIMVLGKHRRGAHGWYHIGRLAREPARA